MAHPLRIQLSRKKGWKKPAGAVVVSRPSKWGNPYPLTQNTPRVCVELYQRYITAMLREGLRDIEELRGKQLACWCALDQPCHADVLAELANA